jgi:ribonuclease T1
MLRSLIEVLPHRFAGVAVLAVLALVVMVGLAACSSPAEDPAPPSSSFSFLAAQPPAEWDGGTVAVDQLPSGAHETLALIARDGPYPYDQDGSTFQNREGLLPDRQRGFYREFTVETPGLSHRGARRFVVGDDAAAFYTDDHYDSFRFVAP